MSNNLVEAPNAEAFELMFKALERVSAHFWKIRPPELHEPSALMVQVDDALFAARAQRKQATQ